MLDPVLIDGAEDRIVRAKPKVSFVAVFLQLPDLQEQDGCFQLAESIAGADHSWIEHLVPSLRVLQIHSSSARSYATQWLA